MSLPIAKGMYRFLTLPRGAGAAVSAHVGVEYTCKETQGAALELKSSACSESIYDDLRLRAYILQHHEQWHSYVRDVLQHRVEPSEIRVVSGWTKTSPDWQATAFSGFHTSHRTHVGAHAGSMAGADVYYGRSKAMSGPKLRRQGPLYSEPSSTSSSGERQMNHCVFMKGYRVKKRLGLVRELVAGVGPYKPPGHEDGGSGKYGEGIEAGGEMSVAEAEEAYIVFSEQEVGDTPGHRVP